MKTAVVAYDQNRGIGIGSELPWGRDLPSDIQHFRELSKGKSVVMGRTTYEAIGRPLPERQNIVVTHRPFAAEGIDVVQSLPEAYAAAKFDVCIIGGGAIYAQALADTDVVYATEVQAAFPGTTAFFPELGAGWKEVEREHHEADEQNKYAYDFVTYKRR